MQNWKLIKDSAQMKGPEKATGEQLIRDSGFASTAHPKLKFNFTMDIVIRSSNSYVLGSNRMEAMDIPLKTATRPNQNINLVDMNFYNYRTKIATKVEGGTGTVVMYDDGNNAAHNIYMNYMNALSPITNVGNDKVSISNPSSAPFGQMSSIGAMPNNPNGLIETLSVYHFYYANGQTRRMQYKYINPKVQVFELDELSMSESDVNTITMTFFYDSVTLKDELVP